ncbi:MAG TPA: hypothetical protein VM534_00275, partial [Thermoanaerobaculia bacterium]|nr:hypothetical protein [Thermoanaerobaculia bacterium]
MSSIYRKSGETVRVEQIRSVSASLRIREGGVCEWGGTLFRSRAIPADRDFSLEETAVESVARQIRGIVAPPVEIERMTLVCGAAQHELSEQGESRRWEDRSTRLHLSLIERSRRLRATIDLGAPAIEDIDLNALDRLTRTLALPSAPIPGGAIDLALSPNVAAAVVPAILLHPELSRVGPLGGRFQIFQRSSSALDGRGEPIEERLLYDGEKGVVARSWPNVYRPSYRTLPSAAPFTV